MPYNLEQTNLCYLECHMRFCSSYCNYFIKGLYGEKFHDTERYCISDHYVITFSITEKVKRKLNAKRLCYNYKKANWKNLNEELKLINWEIFLDHHEPVIAWQNFKKILFSKVDNHIPKFVIKMSTNPLGLTLNASRSVKKKINCTNYLRKKKRHYKPN